MFQFHKRTVLHYNHADTAINRLAGQLALQLKLVSGLQLKINKRASASEIEFIRSGSSLSKEAYRLQVTPSKIRIEAASPNVFFLWFADLIPTATGADIWTTVG